MEILTQGHKSTCKNIHCSIICHSERLETSEKSMPRKLVKLRTSIQWAVCHTAIKQNAASADTE